MPKQYTCACCHNTYDLGWSEEEAEAKLKETFPGFDKSACNLVCDDCYKEMGFGKET